MTDETTNETAAKRPRRSPLNVSSLKIEAGVAVPKVSSGPRGSAWDEVLEKLQIGDSIFVPGRDGQSLAYVRSVGKRLGMTLTVRSVKENGNEGTRIFRVAPPKGAEPSGDGL